MIDPSLTGRPFQVTSVANDTKWRELQKAMATEWPRAPWWRVKWLPRMHAGVWELEPNSRDRLQGWDRDWYYHFRSHNTYKEMEWVDLKPDDQQGMMTLDEIIIALEKIGFDWELEEHSVRVFGYRRLL